MQAGQAELPLIRFLSDLPHLSKVQWVEMFLDMEVRWTSKGSSVRFVQYVFSRFLVALLPNSQGPTWDPHNFWTLLAKDRHVGGWIFDSAPGPKQSKMHMTTPVDFVNKMNGHHVAISVFDFS